MASSYPKPDFRLFFKALFGTVGFLVLLHWLPDIATWIYAHFYGEAVVVDPQRFRMITVVAYVMAGVATIVHLAGLLWATWKNRKR